MRDGAARGLRASRPSAARKKEIAGALTSRGRLGARRSRSRAGSPLAGTAPGAPARAPRRAPPARPRTPARLRRRDRGAGDAGAAAAEIAQGDYAFERYKSAEERAEAREGRPRDRSASPVAFAPPTCKTRPARRRPSRRVVGWARDLGNTPANDLGPAELAREARRHGAPRRAAPDGALGRKQIEREKMAGLLAVNSGSVRPPAFLIGEYRPRRAEGHRGPGRQGDHVRLGRDLDQAGALDGRDEVRHDGRGDGVRLRLRREDA